MRRALAPVAAALVVLACSAPPLVEEPVAQPTTSAAPRELAGPTLPDGRSVAIALTRTEVATCVLLADRTVWCFGGAYASREFLGGIHQVPVPPVTGLVASPSRALAWTASGEVFLWGIGERGRLLVPQRLDVDGAREIAVAEHAICVRYDDHVTCTGESEPPVWTVEVAARAISIRRDDRCYATPATVHCAGMGTTQEHPIPDVVELAASASVTCARTKDRRVFCWSTTNPDVSDEFFGARAFVALAANDSGMCALPLVGPPACVMTATTKDGPSPRDEIVRAQRGVTSMQVSSDGACFIEGGEVRCWEVGQADTKPVDLGDVASLRAAEEVAVGSSHACLLGKDGEIRCWGATASGALGVATASLAGSGRKSVGPSGIGALPPIAHLAAGPYMTCGVTRASGRGPGGRVLCTGAWMKRARDGYECRSSVWPCTDKPTRVTDSAAAVSLGDDFGCVLGTDGGVRCWGSNDAGQLGTGDALEGPELRPVVDASGAAITRVRKVVAGDLHACALREDGAVDCWGYDAPGYAQRIDPTRVRTAATRLALPAPALDLSDRCVVLEGGELRCWGARPDGGSSKAPVRVGVCDATSVVRGGCAMGPRGVTCVGLDRTKLGDPSPAFLPEGPRSGPAPVPLGSATSYGARFCGVDAEGHVRCRRLDDAVPEIGDATLPILVPEPTSACPADPLDVPPPTGSPHYL